MAIAERLRQRFVARHVTWNGTVLAVAVYLALAVLAQLVLPAINEVP